MAFFLYSLLDIKVDRITAFISYSSQEKKLAGRLKVFLQSYCGFEVFLAHDDIPGGIEWEKEIFNSIKENDFFVPLISEAFRQSEYADQEIGIAVCLNKKIIPIKLESINPYGFINKYQALQYKILPVTYYKPDPDNMNELGLAIGKIGLAYEKTSEIYVKTRASIIYAFCNSSSFNATNAAIQLLLTYTFISQN